MDWDDITQVLGAIDAPVLLWGPPGMGKTSQACRIAGRGRYRMITLTEETAANELRGFFVPSGDEWRFHDGPVSAAMRAGELLVVNELDKASGDAHTFLLAVLDDPTLARIEIPGLNESVTPAPGFRVIATMNDDPVFLPPALADRFLVRIQVTDPHPSIIAALPENLRDVAARTAVLPEPERQLSPRAWFAYALLRGRIGEDLAGRAVFGLRWEDVRAALLIGQGST